MLGEIMSLVDHQSHASIFPVLELIKGATVGIDMFLINTITNTVHACSSHNVSSRTLNRLVIDRTTTLTADKVIHCYG